MRLPRRTGSLLAVLAAALASAALPIAGAPSARGEDRAATAAVGSARLPRRLPANDPTALCLDYLENRGARRVEDLKDPDVLATAREQLDDKAATWRVCLRDLAKDECGRRGLTNDPFKKPYDGVLPRWHTPMQLTQVELEVLARIVRGETYWQTPREGFVAVAAVVLNRVRQRGYPKTVEDVAHEPWQFSCYNADMRELLYYGKLTERHWRAARAAAAGEDPVANANHYFNPYVVKPKWAEKLTFVRRIGDSPLNTHDFYK